MTYPDGHQDAGLWHKERLIKFCTPIEGAFTMKDHTDFDYDPQEHILSLDQSMPPTQNRFPSSDPDGSGDAGSNLREAMEMLSRTRFTTSFETFQSSHQDSFDRDTLEYDAEEYDKAFFPPHQNGDSDEVNNVAFAFNNTPFLMNMQSIADQHKHGENRVALSPTKLFQGNVVVFSCLQIIMFAQDFFLPKIINQTENSNMDFEEKRRAF